MDNIEKEKFEKEEINCRKLQEEIEAEIKREQDCGSVLRYNFSIRTMLIKPANEKIILIKITNKRKLAVYFACFNRATIIKKWER